MSLQYTIIHNGANNVCPNTYRSVNFLCKNTHTHTTQIQSNSLSLY